MAKVLLVEDDNNLREIYEARLTAEGYEIITAQNGEEALSAAKQNKPDLIISDVMMPRISGFEMLDILRNTDELKNTKVIMLTALGQAEDRNRADNLGADKYLVKSQVTLEDIVNAAKELLDDEPGDVIAPSALLIPAPEPIAAAVPVAVVPSEPVAPPAVIPEPIAAPAVAPAPAQPVPTMSEPLVATPVDPTPQVDLAVAVEPNDDIPTPQSPATTTVTVADPDPITQRISPPAEQLEPIDVPAAVEQTVSTEPVVETPVVAPETILDTAPAPETNAEPQTIAAEEAAIAAQIASFAASDQPAAPVATPTANDVILDDAINKLTATPVVAGATVETVPADLPEETVPTTEPTIEPADQPVPDTEPEEPTDTTSQISGRKVIQPLSDSETGTTNLELLVAQEEAKEAANSVVDPKPVVSPSPTSPPRSGFDPNSIAL